MAVKRFALGCVVMVVSMSFLLASCGPGGDPVETGHWYFDGGLPPNPNAPPVAPGDITGPRGWENRLGQWELVWHDEFTGGTGDNFHNGLNLNNWNIDTGTGAQFGLAGWGNQELQYYSQSADNLRVENGMLILEARNDGRTGTWWQHGGGGSMVQSHRPFTSAKVTSGGTRSSNTYCTLPDCVGRHDCTGCTLPERFSISEGFIEARIRAPRGVGFWPAFWTLGTNSNRYGTGGPGAHVGWPSSGEIDIMEMQGGREYRHISTIHHGTRYPDRRWFPGRAIDVRTLNLPSGVDMASHFHVYGVRWDANTMHFYFNGYNWFTIDLRLLQGGEFANAEAFTHHLGQFINLNLAIGGNFIAGVAPEASLFAANAPFENRSLMVDWVRVYRKIGGDSVVRVNGEIVP